MKTRTRHLFSAPARGLGETRAIAGPPAELAEHVDLRSVEVVANSLDGVQVRAHEGDEGRMTIIGHAAVFDRMSEELGFAGFSFRERIARGAFRKALDADQDVRMLIEHDPRWVLARTRSRTLELTEDPRGLRVYADVAPTTYAADLRVLMERGDVDQMSFGFRVGADEWVERNLEDGTTEVVRTITEIESLLDVSVVTFPAYPQTDASVRSVVAGTEIVGPDGSIDEDALRSLAWRVHRGETDASPAQRDAIDAAYRSTETVSPWIAERALMAACLEPELLAAIPGKRASVSIEEAPADGPAFPVSVARNRLRLMQITSKENR